MDTVPQRVIRLFVIDWSDALALQGLWRRALPFNAPQPRAALNV